MDYNFPDFRGFFMIQDRELRDFNPKATRECQNLWIYSAKT